MNHVILLLALSAALGTHPSRIAATPDTATEIIALERASLEGWRTGDPAPSLAVCDAAITYFHVMTTSRLDGLAAVKALWEPYRGRPLYDRFEMLEPRVQGNGEIAVLTYVLLQQNGPTTARWNATQVYQKTPDGWRIVHSHWSQAAPSR